jgi:glycosyltransferase involved in cell wall biosynthesis
MNVSECNCDDPKVRHDYNVFQNLVAQAEYLLAAGSCSASAVCAHIAAEYASFRHPGIFVSPRLEAVLQQIGSRKMRDGSMGRTCPKVDRGRQHIVHVISFARPVGGDTRYLWRWIERDGQQSHSVVITGAQREEVPGHLTASVAKAGGAVHVIDPDITDPVQRAQALRDHARNADLIVLHLYPDDILPLIAFANRDCFPPIVFIAHADERFWLGATISDVFGHMRESGIRLAMERSGVDAERIAILPIPLPPRRRSLTRKEAKRKLGLPGDSVLMLSIARGMKYKKLSGASFVDAVMPAIERHSNAVVLVIGPKKQDQWEAAEQITHGRLRALGPIADTALYYEAADIYLDSFPFSSNTSLLEAGSYGLPLVSYFPHSPGLEVLGAGTPAIDEVLQRFTNLKAYEDALSRLIDDPDFRLRSGEVSRESIKNFHDGPAWDECLENLYKKAFKVGRNNLKPRPDPTPPGELDAIVNRLYPHFNLTGIIERNVEHLPLFLRIRVLSRLARVDCSFPFGLFLPNRLSAVLGPFMRGWRNLPVIEGWVNARS